MSFSLTRLTIYALLSSLEEDLRDNLVKYIPSNSDPKEIMSEQLLATSLKRFEKEYGRSTVNTQLEDLLLYVDFGDAVELLNKHKKCLPESVQSLMKEHTLSLQSLIPIRNRIAHTRPLNFDDLANVVDTSERLISTNPSGLPRLSAAYQKIRKEPSYVLSLEIPDNEDVEPTTLNNLPLPDYEETGFLGRKKLSDKIRGLLTGPYPVITLFGEGGVGKTALALKIGYDILEMKDCPFEAIVWSTAKTNYLTTAEIKRIENAICTSLGVISAATSQLTSGKSDDPMNELLSYLAQFRILLILDNIETVLDERIRSFLGQIPMGSKVLVTSRIAIGAYDHPVQIGSLENSESIQLLRAIAKSRGVEDLARLKSDVLAKYCDRMKNNPLFIKWFVSAVQSGRTPEQILNNSGILLDYCMSSVYGLLGDSSKEILRTLLSTSSKQTHAELAYMSEMDGVRSQEGIRELMTTSMIRMTSIPRGSSFETSFELSDLAKAYLSKHHPLTSEQHKRLTKKRNQLVSSQEQLNVERNQNPFSAFSIVQSSKRDIVVAKFLIDALNMTRQRRFKDAEMAIEMARNLAPEFFEVHRVDAWVKNSQGNTIAAQAAYDTAIELEPNWAPLRFFYGGFLLRALDDLEGAEREFREALRLEPKAYQTTIELIRVSLYQGKFEKAKYDIGQLLASDLLSNADKRKVCDLELQLHQRQADYHFSQRDWLSTVCSLEALRRTFESIQEKDERMKVPLSKAIPTAERCYPFLADEVNVTRLKDITAWLRRSAAKRNVAPLDREALSIEVGESRDATSPSIGTIVRLMHVNNGGYLSSRYGQLFFHRSALLNQWEWAELKAGDTVKFSLGEYEGRNVAVRVRLTTNNSESENTLS